jgi:hypothetical protein
MTLGWLAPDTWDLAPETYLVALTPRLRGRRYV